jgi:hypothetical protein
MRQKAALSRRAQPKNIAMLCAAFDICLAEYAQAEAVFGNASDHFYHRTLRRRHEIGLEGLASDSLFADYSYAALATWMGWQDLVPFDQFRDALPTFVSAVRDLGNISILDLEGEATEQTAGKVAHLFSSIRLTTAKSQAVVAPSKLLHFISPNLLPPIDNRYTLRFVFGPTGKPSGYPPSELFHFVLATCVLIGKRTAPSVRQAVQSDPQRCPGHAKVIDNAIIGFMKLNRKPKTRLGHIAERSPRA